MADKQLDAINDALSILAESISAIYIDFARREQGYEYRRVSRGPQRVLFSTGTLAGGVWSPSDDINVVWYATSTITVCHQSSDLWLCSMSNDREQTFWDIVSEGLGLEPALNATPDASTIEIKVRGCEGKAYLHHCFTPGGFDDVDLINNYGVPLYTSTDALPHHVRTNVESFMSTSLSPQEREDVLRDHARRLQCEPVGQHLAMIYDAEVMTCNRDRSLKANNLLQVFQCVYSCIRHWANVSGLIGEPLGFLNYEALMWMVYGAIHELPAQVPDENLYVRSFFETWAAIYSTSHKLLVQTPSGRTVARQTTPRNVAIIGDIIGHVQRSLSCGDICMDEMSSARLQDGFSRFVAEYTSFLKIQAECWTSNRHNRQQFWDRHLPSSLKTMQQSIPYALSPRLWPSPVGGSSTSESRTYILGFSSIGHLQLDSLNELPYNQAEALITVEKCSLEELRAFVTQSERTFSTPTSTATDLRPSHDEIRNQKFRTASSVLSRLRWDPAHTGKSYDVGYLDRFEGLKWLALDEWGKATEDEDFIPEHRIRQIKRKDGVVVWDREKRFDWTDAA